MLDARLRAQLPRLLAWALPLAAAAIYLAWLPLSPIHGFFSDDAVFLLLADYFAADQPGPLLNFVREQSHFPTLFPLLLAALDAGSQTPALASAINRVLLWLAIAAVGIFAFASRRSHATAGLTILLCLLLPATTVLGLELWSEFLFMGLAYAALALCSLRQAPPVSLLLAGLLVVLACLTRAAGISLLLAFWLYLILDSAPRRWWLIGGTAIVAAAALGTTWGLSRFGWYFSTGADAAVSVSLGQWPGLLITRLEQLYQAWQWQFLPVGHRSPADQVLVLLLLGSALAGLAIRLHQRRIDAIWALLYLGMLIVWPFQHPMHVSRFLYPLAPLLLFYALSWPAGLTRFQMAGRPLLWLTVGLVLWLGAPALDQFRQRLTAEVPGELRAYTHNRWWLTAASEDTAREGATLRRDVVEGLRAARQLISPADCVYAGQSPLVMLHTRRVSGVFSPAPPGQPPPEAALPECQSLIALPMIGSDLGQPPYYPAALIDHARYRIHTLPDPDHRFAILLFQAG